MKMINNITETYTGPIGIVV